MPLHNPFRRKPTTQDPEPTTVTVTGVGGVMLKADEAAAAATSQIQAYDNYRAQARAPVSDGAYQILVYPDVPFAKCYEYYKTIGKIQNAVDSMVAKVISRHWYFESADPAANKQLQPQIEALGKWETKYNLSLLFEYLIRDWLLCGNSLIDLAVWQPVQIGMLDALERDKYGRVVRYVFLFNGAPITLLPDKFIHTKWIDANREAWGLGAFHAIFNDQWTDSDAKTPKATAAMLRVMQQDAAKIHHKFASPRVIYGFENVSKEVFDRDIAPLISKMNAGDRLALSRLPTLVTESVDGKARFTDSIDLINAEVEAGLQSSTNPVLTQPTPLGTSRVGNAQDDERALGVMEKLRRLMDGEIIPRILGEQYRGKVVFKWGKQDDYDYQPNELQVWLEQGVISKSEVRAMLRPKMALDDQAYARDIAEQEAKQKEMLEQKTAASAAQRSGSIARPSDPATEAIVKAAETIAETAKVRRTRKAKTAAEPKAA